MKRFLVLTKAMLLIHLRNRSTLFWNLAFPIFTLVIYSQIFGKNTISDESYMTWVMPGMVVFNIVAFGLLSSGTLMVTMREKGILRRLQASPIPTVQLVGSYLIVNVLIGMLQSAIIVAFSALAFKVPLTLAGLLRAFPMVVIGIVTCVALGQVISGIAPTAGTAVAIGQIINFSQMFITDTVMPMTLMPEWIRRVAPYLPAYAVVQLVRPPLMDGTFGPELWPSLLVAAAYTLVAGIAAARLFRWSPRA
ncbi:MAG: ABC transporter permease [Anaerolineae bacterium]|nr:ABC transporter permease [Anaerolineae bacterium]